jgi:multidrug resistance efflux pump
MESEQAELTLVDKKKGVEDAERRVKDAGEVDFEQLTQLYEERELHTATENILVERQRHGLEDATLGDEVDTRVRALGQNTRRTSTRSTNSSTSTTRTAVRKGRDQASAERKRRTPPFPRRSGRTERRRRRSATSKDVESLRVLSPRDGIVFYAARSAPTGRATTSSSGWTTRRSEKIGGRVRTHQVLMTVASMERLSVRMQALESGIQYLKEGLPITIPPDAFPRSRSGATSRRSTRSPAAPASSATCASSTSSGNTTSRTRSSAAA